MNQVPLGNQYDKYNSQNPISRLLIAGFLHAVDKAFSGIQKPLNILEIGCGDGVIIHRAFQFWSESSHCVGVDLGQEELRATRTRNPKVSIVNSSAFSLPFRHAVFDLVLAMEVLEHLDQIQDGIIEIMRVGNRDFVFSVPWEPVWRIGNLISGRYWRRLGNTPGHVQHWGRHEFIKRLAATFDVVHVYCPFPWTMVVCRKRTLGGV